MSSGAQQTTTSDLAPEAKETYGLIKNKYLSNGALPDAPDWSSTTIQETGQKYTAPLSGNQNSAINLASSYAGNDGSADFVDAAASYSNPLTSFSTGNFGNNFEQANYGNNFQTASYDSNLSLRGPSINQSQNSGSVIDKYSTRGLSKFQNPYNDLVLNRGLSRLNEQRATGYNDLNAQAFGAGAFGGDRHGIAEGVYMDRALQTEGDWIANQLQSGFANAQNARMGEANLNMQATNAANHAQAQNVQYSNQIAGQQAQDANTVLGLQNQVAQQTASDANNVQHMQNQALGLQIGADNTATQLVNQAMGQGLQNNIALANADYSNVANQIGLLTNTGGLDRGYEQSVIDAGRTKLQDDYTHGLSIAQSMVGMAPPPSTTISAKQNPLSAILPAAGALGAAVISDERTKENVSKPASTSDALAFVDDYVKNRKAWNYKGDGRRREGPMTQDMTRSGHGDVVVDAGGVEGLDVQAMLDKTMIAVHALAKENRAMKKRWGIS